MTVAQQLMSFPMRSSNCLCQHLKKNKFRYGVKDEPNTEGGEYGYDGADIKREEQHGNEGGGGDYDEYERKPFNSNNGDGGS